MRWIAHIMVVFAVIGCLVGAGQARAGYVTHTECKSAQAASSSSDVAAALAPLVVEARQSPKQGPDLGPKQGSNQDKTSEVSDAKHCSYCWASLPAPVGALSAPHGAAPLDLADRHSDSNAVFDLDRPPKALFV